MKRLELSQSEKELKQMCNKFNCKPNELKLNIYLAKLKCQKQ